MNQNQNDADVVKNGRKNALPKEAEVSLRDQIPAKLLTRLNEMKMGQKVVQMWALGNAQRQEWLEREQVHLKDWDEFLMSTAEGPFEGSSSLHIPMPLIVAKTMHARYMQALLGIDPPFQTKARTEASMPRAEMVHDLMGYTLRKWINHRRGIYATADAWVWSWVTSGCGIMKARWDCKYLRYMDVVKVPKATAPKFARTPNGKTAVVPQYKAVEEEQMITKKTFEGPCADHKFPEDVLIIGGQGDPQLADSCTELVESTASELWTLADRKVFDMDVVKEIVKGGPDSKAGSETSSIKFDRARNAGKASADSPAELDRYMILEDYRSVDIDGSGINSEIVMWVHKKSAKILRATYLHRVNRAGERPYFKIDFHKRPGQEYGIGIIEMMHPLSVEMDAHHNLRVDFGMVSTLPFGFYRPTSSINPVKIQLEPGALIPLDNPQQDVYFPNLGNRTAFGLQEEQGIQTMIERLTGINDLSMGALTGAQGATRTATGARALLGESNSNLNVHLARLNIGWEQFLTYLLHMLQQRLPPGFEFRVTGENGSDYFRKVRDSDEIAGDFDFECTANSATSNKQIQQETAQQVLGMVSNPLYIQIGAVTVANIYEAIKNWLKTMDLKDWARFVTKPPNYQYSLSPEEEANAILRGIEVPISPQMDHQGFLSYFEEIYKNDEILGQFSKESAGMLKAQAIKHERMMQALQQAQAQAQNFRQQQQNAQNIPVQAASPGQNPMAGSAPGGPPPGGAPPQGAPQ